MESASVNQILLREIECNEGSTLSFKEKRRTLLLKAERDIEGILLRDYY